MLAWPLSPFEDGRMEGALSGRQDPRHYRARGRPTTGLDQGRLLAAQEDLGVLRELGLDSLAGALAFESGKLVRVAGPRQTRRVESSAGVLYLKVHHSVPLWRRFTFLGRGATSPARREWEMMVALRRAGFDVPEPLAFGESTNLFGCPPRSFLLMREVAGAPLDRYLADGFPDPRRVGPRRSRDAVLRDVSGMVRRFHATGFYHKDLYCCHLIVTPDPRWGRPYFIDLQRVERGQPPRRRWLVKDLAALHLSAPSCVTRADRLRFLLNYLCKSRLDREAKSWVRAVVAKASRLGAHVPKFG